MTLQLAHYGGVPAPVPRDRLIRLPVVIGTTGLQKSTLYELMRKPLEAGGFPRPVRLSGGRAVAWSENAVLSWVNARIAEAQQGGV